MSLGWVLLVVAAAAAATALTASMWGRDVDRRWAGRALDLSAVALVAATLRLTHLLIDSRFEVTYVAATSRREAPLVEKIAALWGGSHGSLLLWSTLAVVGLALGRRNGERRDRLVLASAATIALGSALVLFTLADPFERSGIPALSGAGLTPVLRHGAMAYHPPLLYVGSAMTAVAWCRALRASDPASLQRWLVASGSVMTVALLAGARWAYTELGWGGFWAWDPIENAGLVPWLLVIAAIHAIGAGAPTRRTVAMGAMPFVAVLGFGAINRAGLQLSVHNFAEQRGVAWGLLGVAAVAAAALIVSAAEPTQSPDGAMPRRRSVPVDIFLFGAVVVTVGTIAPLLGRAIDGERAVTTGRFYTQLLGPIAVAGAILVGGVPHWARRHRISAGVAAAAIATALVMAILGSPSATLSLATAATFGLALTLSNARRSPAAQTCCHLGALVLLLGVAGSVAGHDELVTVSPGETVVVADQQVTLHSLVVGGEPGRPAVVAQITVASGGAQAELEPSLVVHPEWGIRASEAAHWGRLRGDTVVMLHNATDGTAVLRVRTRPFIRLVWLGAAAMAVGLVAAQPRRLRSRSRPSVESSAAA